MLLARTRVLSPVCVKLIILKHADADTFLPVAPKDEITQPIDGSPHGSSTFGRQDTATTAGDANNNTRKESYLSSAINDVAALPKGTLDPVYEAKARVLNHAVRVWQIRGLRFLTETLTPI